MQARVSPSRRRCSHSVSHLYRFPPSRALGLPLFRSKKFLSFIYFRLLISAYSSVTRFPLFLDISSWEVLSKKYIEIFLLLFFISDFYCFVLVVSFFSLACLSSLVHLCFSTIAVTSYVRPIAPRRDAVRSKHDNHAWAQCSPFVVATGLLYIRTRSHIKENSWTTSSVVHTTSLFSATSFYLFSFFVEISLPFFSIVVFCNIFEFFFAICDALYVINYHEIIVYNMCSKCTRGYSNIFEFLTIDS